MTCPLHSSDAKSAERFSTRLSEWNLPVLVIGYIRSATNIPPNASYLGFSVNTSIKSSSHLANPRCHIKDSDLVLPRCEGPMDDDKEIEEKDLAATCPNDDGGWNLPWGRCLPAQLLVSPTHLSVSKWVAGYVKWQLPHSNEVQMYSCAFFWEMQQPTNKPERLPMTIQITEKATWFFCILLPRYNTIFPHLGNMVETLHWHSHSKTTWTKRTCKKNWYHIETLGCLVECGSYGLWSKCLLPTSKTDFKTSLLQ